MFLGIFDKGVMNDNHSGKIDMSKSTIILTSNAGVRSNQKVGFGAPENVTYEADEKLISDSFRPELLGRMDARIIFNPLYSKSSILSFSFKVILFWSIFSLINQQR